MAKPQRRTVSPLRGEVRPQKHFCPHQSCSPHSKPSQPPLGAWRAVSSSFILGLAVGGHVVFPPLQSVLSPPAGRVCGDTVDSPLQRSRKDLQGVSPLRGDVRPQKRFCPLQSCSPHSKPSQPPLGAWRAVSSSFILGLAVGGHVVFPPATVRPFAASGPRVWGHSRFSPAAFGPRADHLSVQHFTLHQPGQGRQGLSFDSVRLHISVWGISPPPRRAQLTVVNSASKASVLQL